MKLDFERDWCRFLYDAGIFQTGQFTLKSGKSSPYYMNFGQADAGDSLRSLGEFFARALEAWELRPDLIFGPAYKGLPLAIATSLAYRGANLPWGSFRKEAKGHGDAGLSLGRAPWGGCRIVMVDDVLTTSQTKLEAMEQIQGYLASRGEAPAEFIGVVVGVDRQERNVVALPAPVYALTTMQGMLDQLAGDRLQGEELERCRQAFAQR